MRVLEEKKKKMRYIFAYVLIYKFDREIEETLTFKWNGSECRECGATI